MVGYVIHAREDLDDPQRARAQELGPDQGGLGRPADQLLDEGGFVLRHRTDVTAEFRATLVALLEARARREPALRVEEGDEAFEEAQERRRSTLLGVDEGLLVRTLWVAERA